MSDFGTMKARIAGEMKRGELSASSSAVQAAVLSAIAHLERRRFTWNEFQDEVGTASSSTTYVPFSNFSVTPLVVTTVSMIIGTRDYPLSRRTFQELESIDAGQWFGYPDYYAIHGEKFRLYPAPNGDYGMRIAGIKRLTEVSAAASTNASNSWMVEGEELVRLTAKSMLFRDELRNPELATYFKMEATQMMRELQKEVSSKAFSGRLVPQVL